MPKKRRATGTQRSRTTRSLEELPEDIVVDQILVRLPSKDVGRCRVLSKSWLTATSTPRFMLEHHHRQPSLPIIDKDGRPATFDLFLDASAGASNKQQWSFLLGFKNLEDYSLQCSCDGFLIVRRICRSSGARFYIYNPVTRKHGLLRQPKVEKDYYNAVIGFYRYHPSGEYMVLWVSRSVRFSKSSLYVLKVGSDELRQVTVGTASSPSVEHKLLWKMCPSSDSRPPVHHRGSLHWGPYGDYGFTGGDKDIIVFDTEAESFRWMRSPTKTGHRWKLFDMNGTLALWHNSTTPSFTCMDVWVMQDYEAEIWAFKYRIDVSMVEASRQLYLTSVKSKKKTPPDSTVQRFNDMSVLNDRELLMKFNNKHVLRCDTDGKFLGLVNLEKSRYSMSLTQHRLQESIVPLPCHEMQEGEEESPFSTWYV